MLTFVVASVLLLSNVKRKTESVDFENSYISLDDLDSTPNNIKEESEVYLSETNNAVVKFPKTLQPNEDFLPIVEIDTPTNTSLNFAIRTGSNFEQQLNENNLTLTNNDQDYSIIYQTFKDYVKEDIILNSSSSPREFEFSINSNFTLETTDEGGIKILENNKLAYYIYPPVAQDKNSKKINYKYNIEQNNIKLIPANASEFTNVEYPVVIDPTVSWVFSTTKDFILSDPSKIEIVDGVVKLVNNSGSYATDNPYVINKGVVYTTLSGFSETLGANNQGNIRYQLSNNFSNWYNQSWNYRQELGVISNDTTLTDYQVKLTVNTAALISAGKLQSACQDIRVTTDNNIVLPYWIETGTNGCNTTSTYIWTKIPSVTTAGTSVYVYYGNSSATDLQDSNSVFLFFDGFNAAPLNTSIWTATGSTSVSNGELFIQTGSVYSTAPILSSNLNVAFEMRAKWAASQTAYSGITTSNTNSVAGSNANSNRLVLLVTNNTSINQIGGAATGSVASYDIINDGFQFTPTANTYVVSGFGVTPTALKYYQNRNVTNTYNSPGDFAPYLILGYFTGSLAGTTNTTDTYIDFVLARKTSGIEPSVEFGTEQNKTSEVWYWWNGSNWTLTSAGYEESNSAAEVNSNISSFPSEIGTGKLKFKAFLHADNSSQQVELDSVSINYFSSTSPSISSISSTSGPSIGETDITIYGSNFDTNGGTKTYTYTGADQTYTVPDGVNKIKVRMWGGGGGGGHKGGWSFGYQGGGGGYTEADMSVVPGQVLTVMVGAGGNAGTTGNTNYNYGGGGPNCGGTDCKYGGQGGGRSAIRYSGDDVLTAGGGGGGGSTNGTSSFEYGGGGGGVVGEDGVAQANSAYAGKGGTQAAGGAAGSGSQVGATAGQKYLGGRPNSPYSYGGSGGGGYYGGGGGAYTGTYMGGGGGGSGYVGTQGITNGLMVGAVNRTQARSYDLDNGGAGLGGNVSTAGTPGKVIIDVLPKMVTVGGVVARNVRVIDSNTITATIPGHLAGTYDVIVTNPDGQEAILSNAYTYLAPQVQSLSSTSGSSMGGEDVTITGLNFDDSVKTTIFEYTGSDQAYIVPEGVTSVRVKMWGAGGGGGNKGSWHFGFPGGGGGFTEADIAVTPGQLLVVVVGQGGNSGLVGNQAYNYGGGGPNCGGTDCQYGGQGGGRSAIKIGTEDIVTGGGGGGGSTNNSNADATGGAGGGLTGVSGISASNNAHAGKGGTQVAGGAAGSGSNVGATAGIKYLGGRPNTPYSYGGSGGGGYYGGGGGAYTNIYMGGGGGGSSYIGGPGVSNGVTKSGQGRTQANAADTLNNGAGAGGTASVAGQNGRVIVEASINTVLFGDVPAKNIRFINSTTIIATTPAHAVGTVDVTVRNGDGESSILEDAYTFTGPTITSISPVSGSTSGGDTITISGEDFSKSILTTTYNLTNSDQYFIVPDGVTSIRVKMWGAGGGGGNPGSWSYGYPGGGGGYTESDISVNPGDILNVVVGAGGGNGVSKMKYVAYGGGGANCVPNQQSTNCVFGGQGGGRSAIRINGEDILTAGGGGGGGSSRSIINRQNGGAGGGLIGQRGLAEDMPTYAGNGGTQVAGGAASTAGVAGTKYNGGSHNTQTTYAGSGGGGWYGGSTGGFLEPNTMGGGGGGSSYIGYSNLVNPIALQGKLSLQANPSDYDNSGAGAGGAAGVAGQPGKVVISALTLKVTVGGVEAKNVRYIDKNTITAETPEYAVGTVDVAITNPDGTVDILEDAYTYESVTADSVTPNNGSTIGGTEITIEGENFATPKVSEFSYSGVDQTFTVPEGVTSIKVKMWGAGGGGGNPGGWSYGYPGGAGGYTEADLAVTPGQQLIVMVGGGGHSGNMAVGGLSYGGGGASCVNTDCRYGGQGGGRSAIRLNGEDILTAGGGGAGGTTYQNTNSQAGGAGGGLLGENGSSAAYAPIRGIGGGQISGGAGGIGDGSSGGNGSKYNAGSPLQNSYGGGGGGGWYGGGSGAHQGSTAMGGGGGGSSYITDPSVIVGSTIAGAGQTQPKSTDAYNDTAGRGGNAVEGGKSGRVVIITNPITVKIGGEYAKEVTYLDSNTIKAVTPRNSSGTKDIEIISAGITYTLESAFTYTGASVESALPTEGTSDGGTQVTISGSDLLPYLYKTTYDYLAKDQKFVATEGVDSVNVKLWGGGGGGGVPGGWTYGYQGGGGGYTTAMLPVNNYQELAVMVGAGGVRGGVSPSLNFYGGAGNNCTNGCVYGGQGGGRSAIRLSGEDILTAGGGGGGGSSRSNVLSQAGGGAGGVTGQDGLSMELPLARGRGGTQSAGGAGGTGSGNGTAGSKYTGGNVYYSYGGSGGGGWYGGGGGAYQEANTMGGGGGGSGYIGYPALINPISIGANYITQANASDPDNSGAGAGGAASTNGQPGKAVITAQPIQVFFGEERAANVEWIDSETIIATTAASTSGTKDITIITPDGESHVLPSSYTYLAAPTITDINPNRPYFGGGTTLTITGTDFRETPSVKFDGIDATSVAFIDSNTIQAVAPAHEIGEVSVQIINPDGTQVTLENAVIYSESAPVITNIDPLGGPTVGGNEVTITGQNFRAKNSFIYVTDGLVGYWPMNSDTGSTITDKSGNNFNGTAGGGVSDTTGYISNGRSFNGTGYISVPSSAVLNPPNAISMQAWIKPANFTNYMVIAGKFPWTTNYSYQLSTTPQGKLRVDISSVGGNSYINLVSDTTLSVNQWSNVAFTWDGSLIRMYINGVLDANTLAFAGPIFVNPAAFEIGRPSGGSTGNQQYFNGVIDEVMLYNKALNLGEIQQNYNIANTIPFRDGLNSHFKFDESSGQNVQNSIPFGVNAHLGTETSSTEYDPTRVSSNCKFEKCLSFQGSITPQYVNIPTNFNQNTTISFSLWFKTTSTSVGILGQADTQPTQGVPVSFVPVLWIMADGKLRAELYTATAAYLTTSGAVNDGQWHHVVLTGTTNTQSLYLDNVLIGSRSGNFQFNWWTVTSLGTAYTNVGRGAAISKWAYYDGLIDDFRVFNRYLSAPDVDTLYNNNFPQTNNYLDVYFGNRIASNINLVDSTTITLDAPEGDGGPVDVKVVNGDGQEAIATNGYRYIYDRFAIISAPLNIRATEPGTMTVQAQDINGNPIILDTDVTLNLSSSSTSGFFAVDLEENESTRWDYSSVTIPAGNSTATFYYKDNAKGTPTITADSGVAESLPATQQVNVKSKFQFIITGVTTPIKVGVPSSVTVISTDYSGTPLHDYTGTVNFTSTDPATILPADFTFDNSMLGEHTFVNGVTMVTQGEFCVTATDVDDPDITGSQCNIEVTAPDEGTIAKLKILNGSQTIPLDGRTTEITVQAQDINGTGIPVLAVTPLYFYSDSATGEFSTDGVNWSLAPFTTNIPAYATSKNFFYRDSTLGAHTIVVRDDSVVNNDGSGINVGWENDSAVITTAVGSATKLALTGVPNSIASDVVSNAISISMQDIAGNNLTATQDKTVYLTSSNNSILFSENGVSGFSNTLSTKILTGNLTATVYIKSSVSGSTNIVLSDANPADGATGLLDDSKTINVAAGLPSKIVLLNSPSEVVAGEASEVFTVQLQDANNNPSPANGPLTIYLSASNANALFSATSFGATVTTITIPNGNDSVNFYFKQNQYFATQTITIADTVGGFGSGGITDVQTTVNVLTGSPSSLDIIENSYNATAGVAAGPLTAALKNTFGVEIPTQNDLQLYLYTNSTGSTKEFSLLSTPWNAITEHLLGAGQSRFTFYYKDSKSGTSTIKVSDDNNPSFEFGLTDGTLNVTVAAAAPASVKFSSTSKTADAGVATGAITITLYDQYNNIANAPSNRVINLSSSSAGGRFDTASNGAFNGSITSVTINSGQNNKNFFYKDTNIGTPTITLTSSGITGDTQSQNIVAGNVTSYAITATSTSITAGNVLDKLTIRTYNAGNVNIPVPSAFAIDLQTNSTGGRFDITQAGTFDGTVTSVVIPMNQNYVDFYYKDTKAGTSIISGIKSGFTTATRNIQVTAAAASKLAFKDSVLSGLNTGQKSNGIFIQSQDQYGNTSNVTGNTTIYLHSSSANSEFYNITNNLITSIQIPANSFEVPIYYKDFNVGTSTITITDFVYPDSPDQGLTNASKNINITYGNPAKIDISTSSLDLEVGTPSQVTLNLLNQYDQVVPAVGDTVITLSSSSLTGEFDTNPNGAFNLTNVTVPNGISSITFYYRDTISGSATITAAKSGLTSDSITYNLTPTNVFSLVFNNAIQTVTAGESSNVFIIKFRDQYGNYTIADADFTINLSSEEATAQFALANSGPWNVNSVNVLSGADDARFYYKDTVASTKQISVSASGLQSSSQNVIITASEPTSMAFVPNTPQTVAGQIASGVINVVLYDQYSNVAKPSSTLTLNLSSDSSQYQFSATVTPWTPITSVNILDSQTQASFYYKDWIIGNPIITVADNASNLSDITLDFTIVASDATKLIFTTEEQSTFVNTPSDNIEFFVADDNGYETQLNADSTVLVTSSSTTGRFSIDNGQSWTNDITFNILASTSTIRSFKYVDSQEGDVVITISSAGLTSATQDLTVTSGTISKIGIQGENTISAGVPIALTIQTLNTENIPVSVQSSTVLKLETTSSTGEFSIAENPWLSITEVTMEQWQNQKTIYYKDTIAGAATITINALVDQGWEDGIKSIDTNSAAYSRIIFLAKPLTVIAEDVSTQFVIQTVDQYGNFVDADARTVYIHSPISGNLSEDGLSFSGSPLTLNLADGESTAVFYYKDAQPGNKVIQATDTQTVLNPDIGIVDAVTTLNVLGQTAEGIRITSIEYTGDNKIIAGQITGVITIEAYKTDNTPAILGTDLQINLSTLPELSGSFKATADTQAADIVTATIPAGQTSTNVYFTTTKAGTFTLNFDTDSITDTTQDIEFVADVADHFVFLTTQQSIGAGNESAQFRVELQDAYNNAAVFDTDLVVQLSSTGSGEFSVQNGLNWQQINQITLTAGNSDVYFYYKDTVSGSYTLTLDEIPDQGLTAATQTYFVTSGSVSSIRFVSSSNSLQVNQPSNAITVGLYDIFGNPTIAQTNTNIYLYSSSNQGQFALSNEFNSNINSGTIDAGSSNFIFYYKDLTSNNALITVSDQSSLDNPDVGITNASQTQVISWGAAVKLSFINADSSVQAGSPKQLQLRLLNTYNGIVQTPEDVSVYLSSTSGTGLFSLDSSFDLTLTEYTIAENNTGVDLYYKDTSASSVTVTASDTMAPNPDSGLTNATQTFSVASQALSKLVFITTVQNLTVGQVSNIMSVQARDVYGNITTVQSDTPFYLYSTSATGQFSNSTNFGGGDLIYQKIMTSGTSTISFYYKDSTYVAPASNPVIKVSNQFPNPGIDDSITDATQMQAINAGNVSQMTFEPSSNLGTLIAGVPSSALTVAFKNQYGIEIPLTSVKTLYLFSSLGGAQFAAWNGSACSTFGITSIDVSISSSRFNFCYKSSQSGSTTLTVSDTAVSNPDTAWTNATGTLTIDPGIISQIVFNNSNPQTVVARHASNELKIETRNQYGNPTAVTSNRTIFLRSSSSTGEFALSSTGPWGVNFATISTGQSGISVYYRDSTYTSSTPVTITAADSLPLIPDTGWTNATLSVNVSLQTVQNFLVTNISDPQVQGNASSVVVMARDSENFVVDWYTGTITFSSSDSGAVLPPSYTFTTADKGLKTFINGVAFSQTGEHYVRATDNNGIIGEQANITVISNAAGPATQVKFKEVANPLYVQRDNASVPITIQLRDSNNQAAIAGVGGFTIKLSSSSGTGEYSASANGPWVSSGVFTIPQNFNAVNVYYKDSTAGNFTLTASDWLGNADDSGISNDAVTAIVNTVLINVSTDLEVNGNIHTYVDSPIIYAKNDTGAYLAKADFQISTTDAITNAPKQSNLVINWKGTNGSILQTNNVSNVVSNSYSVTNITGTAQTGNYTLEVQATTTDGTFTNTQTVNIPVSGWTAKIDYNPDNINVGQPIQFTIQTRLNGAFTDATNLVVNLKDNNGSDVVGTGYSKNLAQLSKTSTGQYSGTLSSNGLSVVNPYYLYTKLLDNSNNIVAEDNNNDIFFENNPAAQVKNFTIQKEITSTAPASETYNLNFSWDSAQYANKYNLYRSTNRFTQLFQDSCTVQDIADSHRFGDNGAVEPFCNAVISQLVDVDDSSSWVKMATVDSPATTYSIPWSQVESDLTNSTYYFILRAENESGESGYSTLVYSQRRSYGFNSTLANTNWISIPYESTYTKASDIVNEIEGGTGSGTNQKINTITLWKPNSQDVESFKYNPLLGKWVGSDFSINAGDGISLILSGNISNFNWTVAGNDISAQLTFNANADKPNRNWLSLPYSTIYANASEIVSNIEGALNTNQKINAVYRWNSTTQSVEAFTFNSSLGIWEGSDFAINPGDGISINLSGGTSNIIWNPYLIINPNK